jgi:hypothetical protein
VDLMLGHDGEEGLAGVLNPMTINTPSAMAVIKDALRRGKPCVIRNAFAPRFG